MTQSQANIQEVELMAKAGAPDPVLLRSKFEEVKAVVIDNIASLVLIKAEKEAELCLVGIESPKEIFPN